jgi:hypothetical protein
LPIVQRPPFILLCKLNTINFDTPDAHFAYLSLFSSTQAENVGNPGKKSENGIRAEKSPNIVP